MKRLIKFLISTALLLALLLSASVCLAEESGVIVLFTNDVHCATEHYATLAAYRAQLINNGYSVITVDAGDAIQGEMIGSLTEGSAIAEIMNSVGYDYAVPGNHEFDYKVETLLSLSKEAQYEYICANFYDLIAEKAVFAPYRIQEIDGKSYAFVGIATPETYFKSTPAYFQDENGNLIYSFSENELYSTVQNAVDSAISEGADYVIAVAHLGIIGTSDGYRSTDLIANTRGIDALIDGHSHETIESAVYKNADGEPVILSSTGTKLSRFGKMTIGEEIKTELISPEELDVSALSAEAQAAHDATKTIINAYNAEFDYLFEEIGYSEVKLAITDENGNRLVRSCETNAGNFVTDAYRTVLKTDIALVNGGGVRAEVASGSFNRKAIMDINPWNNKMCVIEVTGQQIIDALEYGTHASPDEYGSFPHVSGLSFELLTYVESTVVLDSLDNFVSLDKNAPRRVRNVLVNGKPIDADAKYTIAGSEYMLLNNGYTMFKDAKIISQGNLPTDTEILIEYVEKHLNGVIPSELYQNIRGEGRIKIVDSPAEDDVAPGDEENRIIWILLALSSVACAGTVIKKK